MSFRIAVIDRSKCTREVCGYICQKVCPDVKMGIETVTKDEEGWPVIHENLCSGCGICPKKCPVGAITIINLPNAQGAPTYQYAVNSFRLHGLMLPKKGSVVGVIGVNGIGKSTSLELLRGAIKPNFGKFDQETSWEEVRRHFRGNEIQSYLESLSKGEVKVAHKMQYVDKIANSKITVKQLLDQCNASKELIEQFQLNDLLERTTNKLSGGELQRLAICCTIAKTADVYFFDEMSSYLDVSQRFEIAKKIQKLAVENQKGVMCVEHDLGLLDYLSDYVHVVYGQRGAFGVVSELKSAKQGINEYLDGFLKAENMRFRVNSIKFDYTSHAERNAKRAKIIEYFDFTKTYGKDFALKVNGGFIGKGEVIGILGPNATGKSTFVKILAGLETSDDGIINHTEWKVAYKPQSLLMDFDGTVRDYIYSHKDIDLSVLNAECVPRLELQALQDKEVKHLSGGELQRLHLAVALSRKAGLRLLDEPSSFLDVEQRLAAAHLVKRVAESTDVPTLVVDHDLLFIDQVSDGAIVFSGEPGKNATASAPISMRKAMNEFLKDMNITFRRDPQSGRPRANKLNSQMDQEQKSAGEYYYQVS